MHVCFSCAPIFCSEAPSVCCVPLFATLIGLHLTLPSKHENNSCFGSVFVLPLCWVCFYSLHISDHVDGVHLPSFSKQVVKQLVSQTIKDAINFTQSLHFNDDIMVAKTINGHFVDEKLNIVLLTQNSTFYGKYN